MQNDAMRVAVVPEVGGRGDGVGRLGSQNDYIRSPRELLMLSRAFCCLSTEAQLITQLS